MCVCVCAQRRARCSLANGCLRIRLKSCTNTDVSTSDVCDRDAMHMHGKQKAIGRQTTAGFIAESTSYHVRGLLGCRTSHPVVWTGIQNAIKFFPSPFLLIRLGASPSGVLTWLCYVGSCCVLNARCVRGMRGVGRYVGMYVRRHVDNIARVYAGSREGKIYSAVLRSDSSAFRTFALKGSVGEIVFFPLSFF